MNEIIKKLTLSVREHILDIKNMGADIEYSSFQSDTKLRKAIEWSIVSAVEICINIGRHIISEKCYRVPENNREVFEVLQENNVIDDHTLERMKMAVEYRNMAIHRYGDIDSNTRFIIMKQNYKEIENFLKTVICHSE